MKRTKTDTEKTAFRRGFDAGLKAAHGIVKTSGLLTGSVTNETGAIAIALRALMSPSVRATYVEDLTGFEKSLLQETGDLP